MKKCTCGLIASLFLLAGASSGLRAENGQGRVTKPVEAARPQGKEPGQVRLTVKLPDVGPEVEKFLLGCELNVTLMDDAESRPGPGDLPITQFASLGKYQDRSGRKAWHDSAGKPVPLFLFSGAVGDARILKMRVKQLVSVPMGGGVRSLGPGLVQELEAQQTMPLPADAGEISVPFLFDLVSIDASAVAWGSGKGGVWGISWTLTDAADPARKIAGRLSPKDGTTAATLVQKDGAVTAAIEFICYGNRRVKWPGSGEDLRKTGLKLVLSGDGCAK